MNAETDLFEGSHRCEGCGEIFTQKQDFYHHPCTYVLMKQAQNQYKCELCEKQFNKSWLLKTHFRIHTGEKPYICNICQRKFTRRTSLKCHIATHKYNIDHLEYFKPFHCDICGDEFEKKLKLNAHRRKHAKEELFACDICKKVFSTKASLSVHREKTHSKATS